MLGLESPLVLSDQLIQCDECLPACNTISVTTDKK